MFGKILVPVDGSDKALYAAKIARKVAEQCHSSVTLLFVTDFPAYMAPERSSLHNSLRKDLEETAHHTLEQALELFEGFDETRITTRLEHGHAGDVIVKLSKEEKFSLIVMGRRGLSGLAKLLLGSVSNYVLHYAECPTLIVKHDEE